MASTSVATAPGRSAWDGGVITNGSQLWQTHDVVLLVVRCIYILCSSYYLRPGSFSAQRLIMLAAVHDFKFSASILACSGKSLRSSSLPSMVCIAAGIRWYHDLHPHHE